MQLSMRYVIALAMSLLLVSCTQSPESLKKTLSEHPDIVFDVLEKNAQKFGELTQKASMEARRAAMEKAQAEKAKEMQEEIKNPKRVPIQADRAIRGKKDAPIVLVEYSDFQCPYCQRGFQIVDELRKKYGDKMQIIYKHMPLEFHPLAMPAAKRFEAIAMQSSDKAYKYHDCVFTDQKRLGSEGEKFLDECAKKAGADVSKMKKDMELAKVKARIEEDTREAQGLGIRGTPGFLLNGVVVHGAVPIQQFEDILAKRPSYN